MAGSVSLGPVLWTGGMTWNALISRQLWAATKTVDSGSASAVAPHAGVYPGGGEMKVTTSSGLAVTVSAGYCCVPHPTAGDGCYVFGAMASNVLTVTANSSGNPRIDLVAAFVSDVGSSSSACGIEVIAGTPASSPVPPAVPSAAIPLAQIAVANGASSITSGNITDRRNYTVPAGCVLPVASAATSPAASPEQLMVSLANGLLLAGTGTAGSAAAIGYAGLAGQDVVNTSSGGQGSTPGTPSSDPWGIGYGEVDTSTGGGFGGKGGGGGGAGGDTDGTMATEMQVAFAADGLSDYEFHWKWGLPIPAEAYAGGTPTIAAAQVTLSLLIDGNVTDSVSLICADNPKGSSGGGSASWYTSQLEGTTLSPGLHTASLAVETAASYNHTGPVSGVFIGATALSGATIFGASSYYAALVAENCVLRVQSVPAS